MFFAIPIQIAEQMPPPVHLSAKATVFIKIILHTPATTLEQPAQHVQMPPLHKNSPVAQLQTKHAPMVHVQLKILYAVPIQIAEPALTRVRHSAKEIMFTKIT